MEVSKNGGTQQPWVFLLKTIILGCFGGTTIFGNIHVVFKERFGGPTNWPNYTVLYTWTFQFGCLRWFLLKGVNLPSLRVFHWHPLEGVLYYINVQNGPEFYLNHFVNVQEIHDPQIPFLWDRFYILFHEVILASKLKLLLRCQEFLGRRGIRAARLVQLAKSTLNWPNAIHSIFQLIDWLIDWLIHSFIHSFIQSVSQSVIHSCVDELPFSFIICPNYINARKLAVNLGGCRLKGDVTNCVKFVSPAVKGFQQKNRRLPEILGPCLYIRWSRRLSWLSRLTMDRQITDGFFCWKKLLDFPLPVDIHMDSA